MRIWGRKECQELPNKSQLYFFINKRGERDYGYQANSNIYPRKELRYPLEERVLFSFQKEKYTTSRGSVGYSLVLPKSGVCKIENILLVGDSVIANGYSDGIKDIEFHTVFGRKISERAPAKTVLIENLACPGYNVEDITVGLEYWASRVGMSGGWVLFMAAYNDAIYSAGGAGQRIKARQLRMRISLSMFLVRFTRNGYLAGIREKVLGSHLIRDNLMSKMHRKLKATDSIDIEELERYRRWVHRLIDLNRSHGTKTILVTSPFCRWNTQSEYQEKAEEIVHRLNGILEEVYMQGRVQDDIVFCDAAKMISGRSSLFLDCIHLNEGGIQVVCSLVIDSIEKGKVEGPQRGLV